MKAKIIFSDKAKFEEISEQLSQQTAANFFVLADFNKTFTKAFINGRKVSTSFASIRNNNYLGEEYIKEAQKNFDIYHPIEINAKISFEEKDKKMTKWWKKHFDMLIKYGLTKQVFEEIIDKKKVELRNGVKEFLTFLRKKNIPLILVSSGLGDFIPIILKKNNIFFDNVYIISNFFEFNKTGKAIKMKEKIIHTSDKRIFGKIKKEVYQKINKKKNILLLGDDLTDLKISDGFDYDNLIKIVFLNEKVEENLGEFKSNFDVVLTGDQDFSFINKLMKELFG